MLGLNLFSSPALPICLKAKQLKLNSSSPTKILRARLYVLLFHTVSKSLYATVFNYELRITNYELQSCKTCTSSCGEINVLPTGRTAKALV